MTGRMRILGTSSGVLAVALIVGSGVAAAQTSASGPHGREHGGPLTGLVQGLGPSSFQLSANGTLTTVTFTSATRVSRMVSGSTTDLTRGAHVDLQLASGGATVKAVHIAATWSGEAGNGKPGNGDTHTWTGTKHHGDHAGKPSTGAPKTKPSGPKAGTPRHTPPAKGMQTHADGQVLSFNSSTGVLSVRVHGTQTATYTVSGSVVVTKIVAGRSSDLANGETVRVLGPTSGAAKFIEILAA